MEYVFEISGISNHMLPICIFIFLNSKLLFFNLALNYQAYYTFVFEDHLILSIKSNLVLFYCKPN
jgi:hypothetical protein